MWYIISVSIVFLIVVGVQFSIVGFPAIVLILISGGEGEVVGPNILGESVGRMVIILFNALLPCVILFSVALILDSLAGNRVAWLKVVLPFVLMSAILAVPVLIYFFVGIPEIIYSFWRSIVDELVILLVILAVTFALFVPYWYSIQIERSWSGQLGKLCSSKGSVVLGGRVLPGQSNPREDKPVSGVRPAVHSLRVLG